MRTTMQRQDVNFEQARLSWQRQIMARNNLDSRARLPLDSKSEEKLGQAQEGSRGSKILCPRASSGGFGISHHLR